MKRLQGYILLVCRVQRCGFALISMQCTFFCRCVDVWLFPPLLMIQSKCGNGHKSPKAVGRPPSACLRNVSCWKHCCHQNLNTRAFSCLSTEEIQSVLHKCPAPKARLREAPSMELHLALASKASRLFVRLLCSNFVLVFVHQVRFWCHRLQ